MKTTLYILSIMFLVSMNAEAQRRESQSSRQKKERTEVKQSRPASSPASRSKQVQRSTPQRSNQKEAQPARSPQVNRPSGNQGSRPAVRSRETVRTTTPGVQENRNRTVTRQQDNSGSRSVTGTRQNTVQRSTENPARTTTTRRVQNTGRETHVSRDYSPGQRNVYHTERKVVYTRPIRHHYTVIPQSRAYRARHYVYRAPVFIHIHWSYDVYHHYRRFYPVIGYWGYNPHYVIQTISAYDAWDHVGHVRRVYGHVSEAYHYPETDEYHLYIGAYYPYHDLVIILPGHVARRYSWNPERYFTGRDIVFTGLITEYDGKPEMVIKEKSQLKRY